MSARVSFSSNVLLALPTACLALLLFAAAGAGTANAQESGGALSAIRSAAVTSQAADASGQAPVQAASATDGKAQAQAAPAVQQEGGFSFTVAADGTATVVSYAGSESAVTVPATLGGKSVTALAGGAFADNLQLKEVTLPATLTACVAGTAADGTAVAGPFTGCANLSTIAFSKGATQVPTDLLTGCTSLKVTLAIPDSVTTIPQNMGQTQWLTIKAHPGTEADAFAQRYDHEFVDATIRATSVTLDATQTKLTREQTTTLHATVAPVDCEEPLAWSSSDPSVVTVSADGTVTPAGGLGSATVTATAGRFSASCTANVWQPVTAINLNRSSFQIEAGEVRQMVAEALPADATNKQVTWSSSNPSVASVNAQTGLVTGVSEGSATITATAADGAGATQVCTVTVTSNAYAVTDPAAVATPHPYAPNCADSWTYTLRGAQAIYVTFDKRTAVENTFDAIRVYDGSGALVGTFTGTELAGATLRLTGDTVTVKLDSDETVNSWGFALASVTDATPDGLVTVDGVTYLYDHGTLVTGEVQLDGKWYYFDVSTGAMATGMTQLPNGRVVCYSEGGFMLFGDAYINGVRYRLDPKTGDLLGVGDPTPEPTPTPEPEPEPTVEEQWNLVFDETGTASCSYFSLELPDAWKDQVQVSLVTSGSTPYASVSLPGQPDQRLATLTVVGSAGYTPTGGDSATTLAGWWDNGKGQVVELRVMNPAVVLYNDMVYGTSSFPSDDVAAKLISLASGGACTIDDVRAATSEQQAAQMCQYSFKNLPLSVYVPRYNADGNVVGSAENGMKAPEELSEPEEPATPETPEEPATPAEPVTPEEPAAPEEPVVEEPVVEEPTAPAEPAVEEPTPVTPEEPVTPEDATPDNGGEPVDPEPAATPEPAVETPVELEPEPEPAAALASPLSLENAQQAAALNELLNTFAWAYPDATFDAASYDPADPVQVEQLARLGVNAVLQSKDEGEGTYQRIVGEDDTVTVSVNADLVFQAVKTACDIDLDLWSLASDTLLFDGATVSCAATDAFSDGFVLNATALTDRGDGTFEVALDAYAAPAADIAALVGQAKTDEASGVENALTTAAAAYAEQQALDGAAPQAGTAIVRATFSESGELQQLSVVSIDLGTEA